jgi:hypothetical protein
VDTPWTNSRRNVGVDGNGSMTGFLVNDYVVVIAL